MLAFSSFTCTHVLACSSAHGCDLTMTEARYASYLELCQLNCRTRCCSAVYNGLWSENPLARKSPLLPNDTITHHLPRSFLCFILFYNKPYTTLVSGHNDTSGKSTLAASLNGQTFAADDYFNRDGKEKMEEKKYYLCSSFLPFFILARRL